MMLQNLNKILDRYEEQLGFTNSSNQFEQLRGLPFYDWSIGRGASNRITTFNNVIGLPQKNGRPMPLFDYEQMLFSILQNHKHIWIKKATGLGVTEFMLRYMAWLCFAEINIPNFNLIKNFNFRNTQMCFVTGPRIELAITLIDVNLLIVIYVHHSLFLVWTSTLMNIKGLQIITLREYFEGRANVAMVTYKGRP